MQHLSGQRAPIMLDPSSDCASALSGMGLHCLKMEAPADGKGGGGGLGGGRGQWLLIHRSHKQINEKEVDMGN